MSRLTAFAVGLVLLGCSGLMSGQQGGHAEDRALPERPERPERPDRAERGARPEQQGGRSKGTLLAESPLPNPVPVSAFALGLNESVSIPARLVRGMSLEKQSYELNKDAAATVAVGARLVRGHTGAYPLVSAWELAQSPDRLEQADAWVAAVQGAGLEPVMMVSPWPGNYTGRVTDHYLPDDMAKYSAYVQALVERYDGDGVDDMPQLRSPVRYWEVDNEPDLKNSIVARGARSPYDASSFCKPAEYAQVLLSSASAIKAAFPEAKVLNAGLYRPFSEQGSGYFRDLVAVPGVLAAIDILSVHTYHDDLDGERLAVGVRNLRFYAPTKPVWVTETSLGTNAQISVEEQGRMVATFTARVALEGADKLFWHTLADPPPDVEREVRPMFGHSLFSTDASGVRTPKPAADVFKNLAAFLASHDLNGCVADGEGAVKLRDGSVLLYAGSRKVSAEGASLRTGAALKPGDTAAAPAWLR